MNRESAWQNTYASLYQKRKLNKHMNAEGFATQPGKTRTVSEEIGRDRPGLGCNAQRIRPTHQPLQMRAGKMLRLHVRARARTRRGFVVRALKTMFIAVSAIIFSLQPAAASTSINFGEIDPYDNMSAGKMIYQLMPARITASDSVIFRMTDVGTVGMNCKKLGADSGICFHGVASSEYNERGPFVELSSSSDTSIVQPDPTKTISRVGLRPEITRGGKFEPGLYSQEIGTMHVFTVSGTLIHSEHISAQYTITQQPCTVIDNVKDFGKLSPLEVSSGAVALPFSLDITCPPGIDGSQLSVFLSSPNSDGNKLLDANGGNVELTVMQGSSIVPLANKDALLGTLKGGANQVDLRAQLSTESNEPAKPGTFNMILNVDVVYR